MINHGIFITVEGMDGCGKTSQIKLIQNYLKEKKYEVISIREPGGTIISEKIRNLILDPNNKEMSIITEMFLYAAARSQLIIEIIKPALKEGKIVICDRFVDSSYAYQSFGRNIDLKTVEKINMIATEEIQPDITFFFDISPEITMKRIADTTLDRIEQEKIEFHQKVYNGYKDLVFKYPNRIKAIQSNKSIEEIFNKVKKELDYIFIK